MRHTASVARTSVANVCWLMPGLLAGLSLMCGCTQDASDGVTVHRQMIAPGAEERVPAAKPGDYPLSIGDYPFHCAGKAAPGYRPLAWLIEEPPGFKRVPLQKRSWAQWLRHLPMLPAGSPVRNLSGTGIVVPADSPNLGGVVDIPVRENQECADVVMRLRAEYLLWAQREDEIGFELGDGRTLAWKDWRQGMRVQSDGGRLQLVRRAGQDDSREAFDRYLSSLFAFCGTYSLAAAGRPASYDELQVGDFFVHAGSPGHAVLVADLAEDGDGRRRALLLQGYMPAQSVHVMAPGDDSGSSWFELARNELVDTPFWGDFDWSELRHFK